MEIEKLKDRLLEWDGVDTVDNGEFIEVNYHGVFDLLREAADALEQLQAENGSLRKERDAAVEELNATRGDIEEIRRCNKFKWRGPKEE